MESLYTQAERAERMATQALADKMTRAYKDRVRHPRGATYNNGHMDKDGRFWVRDATGHWTLERLLHQTQSPILSAGKVE